MVELIFVGGRRRRIFFKEETALTKGGIENGVATLPNVTGPLKLNVFPYLIIQQGDP
jgi:hypothetical protein